MATFDSTQFALRATQTSVPSRELNPNEIYGRVRVAHADIPPIVGLAQNDLVNLFELPRGARCLMVLTKVNVAYATSTTVDIGFAGDEDALQPALAVSTPIITANNEIPAVNIDAPLAARTTVQAKFEGATPGDTGTMSVTVLFVVD